MKFLKTLNKLLEGLLWFYLPIVLFYWALTLINLSILTPIRGLLATVIQPFTLMINSYGEFNFSFENIQVNYTPLILAISVLAVIGLLFVNNKIIDLVEILFNKINLGIKAKTKEKQKEQELQLYKEELERNKNIYAMIQIFKLKEHDDYLVKSDDGAFSTGIVDSYNTSLVNLAKKFSAVEYTDYKAEAGVHSFIFSDTERLLHYLILLNSKIHEINKGTAELNTIFSCKVACSCSYSITSIEQDLSLTQKILNLASKDEIFITDVLKNKIKELNSDFVLKIESKGLYMLNEQYVEVHKIKVS